MSQADPFLTDQEIAWMREAQKPVSLNMTPPREVIERLVSLGYATMVIGGLKLTSAGSLRLAKEPA